MLKSFSIHLCNNSPGFTGFKEKNFPFILRESELSGFKQIILMTNKGRNNYHIFTQMPDGLVYQIINSAWREGCFGSDFSIA